MSSPFLDITPLPGYAIDGGDLDGFGPDLSPSACIPPGLVIPKKDPYQDVTFDNDALPLREHAPKLPWLTFQPSTVRFMERFKNGLGIDAPSGVFRVAIEGVGERVFKIFHNEEYYRKGRNFDREAHAYAALIRDGVCAAGAVPHCYGWTAIDQSKWPVSGKQDLLLHFRDETKLLRTLVLEFLPNASQMTLCYTNPETTKNAMVTLDMIHEAGVIHSDVHPRNILVLPEGRVVWIDFECSSVWPRNRYVNKRELLLEMGYTWCWLYLKLLPWKWYALRCASETGRCNLAELEAIEEDLLRIGFVKSV